MIILDTLMVMKRLQSVVVRMEEVMAEATGVQAPSARGDQNNQ